MKKVIFVLGLLFSMAAFAGSEVVQLGTANTVTLRGEINDSNAQSTALELINLAAARGTQNYPIYLVLDTPGGSIDAGENLIEIAKTIPNLKTITVFAASMGSAIVEALPGERLVIDSGVLMFHRARGGVTGQFETGELETRLEFYKKFVRRMEQRNADRLGLTLKEYKRKIKDEMWLTSGDSLKSGAADKVVALTCTQALIDKNQHASVEVFIFKIELDYSGCPLLRTPSVSEGQPKEALEAYKRYSSINDFKEIVRGQK